VAGQPSILGGAGNSGNTQGEALTRYWTLYGGSRANATESLTYLPVRDAGTIKSLYVHLSANGIAANTTFTVRKNVADTSMTVTYSSSQTGQKQDTTNTATVADGDEIDVKCVTGDPAGSGTTLTLQVVAVEFVPDASECLSANGSFGAGTAFSTASTTRYMAANGSYSHESTESYAQTKVNQSCNLKDLWVHVSANARTTDTVFRTRVNGANGAQSVTYTSGQTGLKEDASNTDSLVAGDLYCFAMVTLTGTDSITPHFVGCWLKSTNGDSHQLSASSAGGTITSNITRYVPIVGAATLGISTEANAECLAPTGFTARDLQCYVRSNTLSGANCVVTLRDNQADSSLTVTYTSSQTGWKLDSSNTATIGAADEVCIKVSTVGASGGQLIFHSFSIEGHTDTVSDTTLTPSTCELATTAPTPTVALTLTAAADTASVATSAPTPAIVLTNTLTPDAAETSTSAPAAGVALEYVATPDPAEVATTAPAVTAGAAITLTPDPATLTTTPAETSRPITVTPDAATLTSSAPEPAVTTGEILSPDAATLGTTVAGSVAIAVGGINRYVTGQPRLRTTAPEPTLAFGGISLTPDAATTSAGIAAPSVSHGEAVRDVAAAEVQTAPLDPTLLMGGSSVTPAASSLVTTPADVNLAIDQTAAADPTGTATTPAEPTLSFGEKVITPDPAGISTEAPTPTADVPTAIDASGTGIATDVPEVGILLEVIITASPTGIATTTLAPSGGKQLELQDVRPASLETSPTAPTVMLGTLTLTPDPGRFAIRPASTVGGPVQLATDTVATLAHCLVVQETTARCIVAGAILAACTVTPESTATLGKPLGDSALKPPPSEA
jgi:hypothetical protein